MDRIQMDLGSTPDQPEIDARSTPDRLQIYPRSTLDRPWIDPGSIPNLPRNEQIYHTLRGIMLWWVGGLDTPEGAVNVGVPDGIGKRITKDSS